MKRTILLAAVGTLALLMAAGAAWAAVIQCQGGNLAVNSPAYSRNRDGRESFVVRPSSRSGCGP